MKALVSLAQFLLKCFYHLCSILPQKQRIVCISRQSNEEPVDFRLIQHFVSSHYANYRVVILAKALDNKLAYAPHMIQQIYYLATSQAVLLDSYCIAVSLLGSTIKAPVIQMWHAMGNMKKFGFTALDTPEGRSKETARLMHMHEGYDSALISSLSFADDFAAGLGIDKRILFEAPLPKTDLLIDPEYRAKQKEAIYRAVPATTDKRNIVYCPTFRKTAASNESEAMRRLIDSVDFDRFNLIYKKHPVSTQRLDDPRVIQDYPHNLDMLYVADYVISDYSTVIYEAGLLDVPVFLYAYDWNEYSDKRSLNIDLKNDVPTLFTDDPREIMDAIDNCTFDHDAYAAFIKRNIALPPNETCTQHIVLHIASLIEKNSNGRHLLKS